ncbi:tRNA (guanine9-N1)-methyltransferase [Geosmithia morbida]|uniref:tRNA (guanine(9)-N1)-methyltransferase n=1 Tax=Geosmithia morbida TaxID=1094350 RepID=A0A9P5D7Q5_9HYPO|nr:tRNA (guanine9-N1)-methyltransferase [Geosmithia morbida]KAF4126005.1 tRNA (guanine9-N1)-methyltransferase [Geosmithia morbida]
MSSEQVGDIAPPTQPQKAAEDAPSDAAVTREEVHVTADGQSAAPTPALRMSKNALKRLRKQQEWEDGRDDRRKRRKEKRYEMKDRRRERRQALEAQGLPPEERPTKKPSTVARIALVVDCDFEQYMSDKERISLSSQVTRSYSDNRNARYRVNLWMSGWKGRLLDRFETVLTNQHLSWKGVGFHSGDFVECSQRAQEKMRGEVVEPLQRSLDLQPLSWARDGKDPFPLPDPEPQPRPEYGHIIYLTSDSPYTLERLEPNKCYIVGGLVDKNREKGLCYRRARERGIRTARLPIGQFMMMQSRQVLATNHVVEIMLKWLEYEDWGAAFEAVIPKRKGGVLRGRTESESRDGQETAGQETAGQDEIGDSCTQVSEEQAESRGQNDAKQRGEGEAKEE